GSAPSRARPVIRTSDSQAFDADTVEQIPVVRSRTDKAVAPFSRLGRGLGFEEEKENENEEDSMASLSRLRQNLSLWNKSHCGIGSGQSSGSSGAPARSFTVANEHISESGSSGSTASSLRRSHLPEVTTGSGNRGTGHAREGGEGETGKRLASRSPDLKDADDSSKVRTDAEDSSDTWHLSYLERVRERTQEMMKATERLASAPAAEPSFSSGSRRSAPAGDDLDRGFARKSS
ncbi:unnamed protein product, partial [Polarella glacialis]